MRLLLVSAVAGPALAMAAANAVVRFAARGAVPASVDDLPHAEAGLVLGAQVMPDGSPSTMLADRIAAAADLYRAGKVGKLLLSGDHQSWDYDEVGTMRDALLARGIPAQDLFTDHAGLNTWDSAQRARRVFGVRSVVVVTQRFHLRRAVFAAHRAGLDATGYAADRRSYGRVMARMRVREALACVKAVADAVAGTEPRLLGAAIPIGGDGRDSWGRAGRA